MVPSNLTIVSRTSPLALAQVEEVVCHLRPQFPSCEFSSLALESIGDKDLKTPLTEESIPDDFFTREIDQQLIDGAADIAMHSAKDLPKQLPDELCIAALLPAIEIRDALVYPIGAGNNYVPKVFGTSSPRREKYISDHYPEGELKPIRGNINQRLEQLDRGAYDAVIIAGCALQRLGLHDRISQWMNNAEPTPQQGRLAIVTRKSDLELNQKLRAVDVRNKAGLVALVGCPADITLLSPRAHTMIKEADVVFHDRLIPDGIITEITGEAISVGKKGHHKSISQHEIHRLLLEAVEQGKLVVRLQGGDPSILAHQGETLEFLADWDIRVDIIPAPTAAQLASAKAHAPLTHRFKGRSITVMSGHKIDSYAHIKSPDEGNLAIYMGAADANKIKDALITERWPRNTQVTIAQRLGYQDEEIKYTKLESLTDEPIETPAVMLVGSETHRLPSYTLFTGSNPSGFYKHGPLIHRPFIALTSIPLEQRVEQIQKNIAQVDGIIFPSKFAVDSFIEALLQLGDTRLLADKKIYSVGPTTTGALQKNGLRADLSPNDFGGINALAAQLGMNHSGRYYYPCSNQSPQNERIAKAAEKGLHLVPDIFYQNESIRYKELPKLNFSRVIFTSSSTVKAYFENFPDQKESGRQWIAVGHATLKEIENQNLHGFLLGQ